MRNINKVILIGNVARVPEVRTTAGGQKMSTFVLATNRTWYDPQGSKQSQAEFHNMLAWGKVAEICEKFLQKSTFVYIEGYLKTRSWDSENGSRFYRTEIVVQDILVLDKGIRHENGTISEEIHEEGSFDAFDESDFAGDFDSERPATDIEKGIKQRLANGGGAIADAGISSLRTSSESGISLEDPLFQEETR